MKKFNHFEFTVTDRAGATVHRQGYIANYDCRELTMQQLHEQFPDCLVVCVVTPYEMKRRE